MEARHKINMLMHLALLVFLLALSAHVSADVLVYSSNTHEIEATFRDDPSNFGELIPFEGIKGLLVYADPEDACKPIAKPPHSLDIYLKRWFVLIKRYGCKFEDKVRYAQAAGYSLAIVHNVNSSDVRPMGADNASGIVIPSIFVGEDAGLLLKENYVYSEGYYILINGDIPFITPHLLLIFSVLVGLCFLFMVLFIIVKYLKERRRQRRHRLPRSSLKEIPIHKFKKNDPYAMCAICLEEYVENDKLRVLPCSHAYHSKCIDPWLTKNRRVCPVCRRKVFARGEVNTDTESETEDETAPLVRGSQRSGTQGGTFQQERGPRRSQPQGAAPAVTRTTRTRDTRSNGQRLLNSSGSSSSSNGSGGSRASSSVPSLRTHFANNLVQPGTRVQNLIVEPSINAGGPADVVTHPHVEETAQRNLSC